MRARTDVVLVATAVVAAGATLAGLAVSRAATAPQMRSRVFDWNQLKPEASKTGDRREVFDAPTATLDRLASHVTTLNPGQAPHPLPESAARIGSGMGTAVADPGAVLT